MVLLNIIPVPRRVGPTATFKTVTFHTTAKYTYATAVAWQPFENKWPRCRKQNNTVQKCIVTGN